MSAHELPATGRGPRVRNNGPVGSVERPLRGLAEWMGHKPGKHPMLPLYPPGDRRCVTSTEASRSDPARTMRELRERRIAEREAEERRERDARLYAGTPLRVLGFAHEQSAAGAVTLWPSASS